MAKRGLSHIPDFGESILETDMPLTVFLSSTLRKHVPEYDPIKGMTLSVDREMTVAELCEHMTIPPDRIKLVMVNGKNESLDYLLKGDERVGLFPPVGGG